MAYQSQKLQLSKSVSSTLDVELEFCKWLSCLLFPFSAKNCPKQEGRSGLPRTGSVTEKVKIVRAHIFQGME